MVDEVELMVPIEDVVGELGWSVRGEQIGRETNNLCPPESRERMSTWARKAQQMRVSEGRHEGCA